MFTRDNWIYKFREKPEVSEGKLVTGLYLLKPKLYELSNNLPRNEKGENNMADFLNVINTSAYRQVDARRMKGYWYDIGTPEILNKANDIKYGSKS
jgi:NDP-sugar pyrophosphorylase family protein